MPSIDERVVSMAFENAKFEAGVAQTMSTLSKLDTALKNIGSSTGLENIERAAQKVTLQQPMSALDKLRQRIFGVSDGAGQSFSDIERAGQKVTLQTPMSALDRLRQRLAGVGDNAGQGFSEIDRAGNRVGLEGPIRAIDKVQGKLGQLSAGSTFTDIERAADRVDLNGMHRALDSVTAKFSTLQAAASVALGGIAAQAAMRGAQFLKSFAFGPIQQGFQEYATNLNSIQTILANTQQSGSTLNDVNGALAELNKYSDQTIYNFSEMARNIGTFTAAGVGLKQSTESIKGIANLAALSGSNSQQASTAMYQLSQAIAAGRVSLQDWNSVVNAGMGGKVFQQALWNTAKAMGTLKNVPVGQTFEQWEKAGNSFRQSLSATQKAAKDGAGAVAKAQKDAAEEIRNAEESAAEAVANARDRVKDARKGVADAAKQTADAVAAANQRVRDAEQGVADAHKQTAEEVSAAQERVREAQRGVVEAERATAQAVKEAQGQVRDARKNSADVAKQAAADLRNALASQKEALKQSAKDVAAALDGVAEAQRRLVEAMKPPSADELQSAQDKLQTAQLDQADLAGAVTDAQREQQRSAEDLAAAQAKLAQLQKDSSASPDDLRAAQRAVEDAQNRASDASDAVERALLRQRAAARGVTSAQQELTDVQNKGTEADKNVRDAHDAVTQALERYKQAQDDAHKTAVDAQRKVTDTVRAGAAAQAKAAEEIVKAQQKVNEARREGAQREAEATRAVIEAQRKVNDARQEGVDREAKAARALIDAQRKVSEARQQGAEREAQAADELAKAQANEVKVTRDSQEQIAKAHEQAAERIQAAKEKANPAPEGAPSWLTSDVLTNTLRQFTGDMTTAQLKAQGFTDAQIKAIQQTANTARKAATEVKTLGQVFDVAKETIGSGWAKTFQLIFGNFGESKKTFTELSNAINGFINRSSDARNAVLADWKELGGRTVLIEGVKNAFHALLSILNPIKDAFREIFPAQTGKNLYDLTVRFRDLMENLKIGPETADRLKRTFAGLFAVVHIGVTIVKGILGVLGNLLGLVSHGSGSFLEITGSIGDFLVALDKAITSGQGLSDLFSGLGNAIRHPLDAIKALVGYLKGLFDGSDKGSAGAAQLSTNMGKVGQAMGPLAGIFAAVTKALDSLFGVLKKVGDFLEPIFDAAVQAVSTLGSQLADAIRGVNLDTALSALQTALTGGIFLVLKKAIGGGVDIKFFDGVKHNVVETLDALNGSLSAIQKNIQANTMLQIAIALGVLAAGVFVLSKIDPKRLTSAMTAMAVGLGELVGAMKLLTAGTGKASILLLPVIAASMILLATAVDILSIAVFAFSKLSWEGIAKGLTGVGGALAAVGLGMKAIGPRVLFVGPALIPLAVGIDLLAIAVKAFASMKWGDIAKGLVGIGGALAVIGIGLTAVGPEILIAAPALLILAAGLTAMAGAVFAFSRMSLPNLAKGILAVGASLAVIGVSISLIPPTIGLQAAGLLVLGVALTSLSAAIGILGAMKLGTIIQGLAAIGASLVLFAVGLTAMSGTVLGAVALMGAATALAILAPTLGFLGNLAWGTILKGLGAVALTLVTIGVVGLVAAPALVAIGVALAALGVGVLVVSSGIYVLAKGISLLAAQGQAGFAVLLTAITGFVAIIPTIVINFVKGLVGIVEELAKITPKVVVAVGIIINSLLDIVIQAAPKLAIAVGSLILAFLKVINDNLPKIIDAGWRILLSFINGISNNIGKFVTGVINIIVRFLDTVTANLPRIIASGTNLLIAFLKGITDNLARVVAMVAQVIGKFLEAVTTQLPGVIAKGARLIVSFLEGVASKIDDVIAAGVRIIVSIIRGVAKSLPRVVDAAADLIQTLLDAIADRLPRLADAGFRAIIRFLHGIADAIRRNEGDLIGAGIDIASAIVEGLVDGLGRLGNLVRNALFRVIDILPSFAKKILGIRSPSTVFAEIGENVTLGLAGGLSDSTPRITSAMDDVVRAITDTSSRISDAVNAEIDPDVTITPVLDLSQVRRNAGELRDLTNVTPITAAASYGQASAVSGEVSATQEAQAAASGAAPSKVINFEQNNYSPESLSDVEIYRQTRNQLSMLKSAVGLDN